MPPLGGATGWLNSEPLSPDELRGHVILVNFWTYTCINWLRTVPHVRAWSHRYRDHGLLVIGVHTPEFSFEHDTERVRRAVVERDINYPVAVDNDYRVWEAFDNRYWPALYMIDADGTVRGSHFGEGEYERSENTIQALLGLRRDLVSADIRGVGVEAEADWGRLRSPETYLGYARSENFVSDNGGLLPHGPGGHALPESLPLNHWALGGEWDVQQERAVLLQAGGRLAFRFQARDAHLVMCSETEEPIVFRVLLDGEPPNESHGVDVDERGHGVLHEGRLYHLVRQHPDVVERTLQITFAAPGAQAYVFTFG